MGKMAELSHLLQTGDEQGIVEFLGTIGWRDKVAALGGEKFLEAFEEINQDKSKKELTVQDAIDNIDGEPTTADKYNQEWLDEENKKKSRGDGK